MSALLRIVVVLAGLVLFAGVSLTPATAAAIRPDPAKADADKAPGYKNGCHLNQKDSTPKGCVYGDKRAKRTITLVGDSKARQWLPTLDRYGKARRWRVVAHTKSACSFSQASLPVSGSHKRYTSCMVWNDKLLKRLRKDEPDVVVVALYNKYARQTSSARTGEQRRLAMAKGIRSSWRAVTRTGARLVVLNSSPYIGTPYPGHPTWEAPDCVAANRSNPAACDVPAGPALTARSVWSEQDRARVLHGLSRVNLVDLNPKLCSAETCRVVIGQVLIYRDNHHLTATAARWLYPYLRNRLDPLIG
ncbi:MAG: acyltransferase 3 [Aeromicrobium sp.]|nr:acyltransferase 3 [Aeromicrobium sp.]